MPIVHQVERAKAMVAKVRSLDTPPLLLHAHIDLQVERAEAMVAKVRGLDPQASVDVDQLALRVTLDVIGLVRGWSW